MEDPVCIVTRGSELALAQTGQLVETLRARCPGVNVEIVTLATLGDKVTNRPLSSFRGTGVFVKELEEALLSGAADLAVHSLKDVPVTQPEGLTLAAFPLRQNPADCLIARHGFRFDNLPERAIVGTGSPRRIAQLRAARPDLLFREARGNLDTRLRRLEEGLFDGIVVAAAGLLRLKYSFDKDAVLPLDLCMPAAGQGCLAIECRETDAQAMHLAATLDDPATRQEVCAEREFLRIIGGGCHTPVGVYAKIEGDRLTLQAVIGDPASGRLARDSLTVGRADGSAAGALAEKMIDLCEKLDIRIER